MKPAKPSNERERLEALRKLDILDTLPEAEFDELAYLASFICETPIAVVSLVDEDRQWFKARVGLEATETSREISFCGHAILQPEELFQIPDALQDERFADNPLVTSDPAIRFYAGAPLVNSEGLALGTICVIDQKPNQLTPEQIRALKALGNQVSQVLELRRTLNRLEQAYEAENDARVRLQTQIGQTRQAQNDLDRFFTLSMDLFCIAGFDGYFKRLNKGWERTLGYSTEDLLAIPFDQLIHPEDRDRTCQKVQRISRGENALRFENRYRCKDGRWLWLSWTATPQLEEELIFAVARDVSEQKAAQQRIEESEKQFRILADASPNLIWTADPDKKCNYFNRGWLEFTGRGLEEELGDGWLDGIHPEDLGKTLKTFSEAFDRRQRFELEYRLRRHDGIYRWILDVGVPLLGADGTFQGYIGSCIDINQRKRIGQERQASEQALTRISEIIAHPSLDFSEKIEEILKTGCIRFGMQIGILARIEGDDYQVVASYALDEALQAGARFSLAGTYCETTIRARAPVGFHQAQQSDWRHHPAYRTLGLESYLGVAVEVGGRAFGTVNFSSPLPRAEPFSAAEQDLIRLIAQWVGSELQRKEAQETLHEAKEAAIQANQAKDQFLANMSHELRTPLNSVIGFSDLLAKNKQGNLDPKQRSYAERIRNNGQHLLSLINDVLDLSKVAAGKMEFNESLVDLCSLIDEIAGQFEVQFLEKGIDLQVDRPSSGLNIYTDGARLKQVLLNLVSNAIKFTSQGHVLISVEVQPKGMFPSAVHVSDTGIGISPEALPRIFEPFRQADSSTSRKYGRTGLGLSISRSMCEVMGHRLTVESEVGQGSRFSVWLSAASSQRPRPGSTHMGSKAGISKAP